MFVSGRVALGEEESLFGLGQTGVLGAELVPATVVDAQGNPVPGAEVTVATDSEGIVARIDASKGGYEGRKILFGKPAMMWSADVRAPGRISVPVPMGSTTTDGKTWSTPGPGEGRLTQQRVELLKVGEGGKKEEPGPRADTTGLVLAVMGFLIVGGLAAYSVFRASTKGRLVGGGEIV